MTTTPAVRGPQVGVPPSLEQVPVGMLKVDQAYQRATDGPSSRKIIGRMVTKWDWRLCQPLVVSRRADGSLYILDGQHRHAGAVERGDIPFLPCVLLSSLTAEDEANTFVAINTQRQKLSQADIFHGQLAAGDPDAIKVQGLLEETGWRIRKSSNSAIFNAGDMTCAPMLVKLLAKGQETEVHFALVALRKAWPSKPVRSTATFIKALIELFPMLAPCLPEEADQRVDWIGKLLAMRSQDRWLLAAGVVRSDKPDLSVPAAMARAIHNFDTSAPAARVVTTVVAANPPPAPRPTAAASFTPPARTAFNLEGNTAWCTQCEQRRTRDNVSSCRDSFCKLKGSQ